MKDYRHPMLVLAPIVTASQYKEFCITSASDSGDNVLDLRTAGSRLTPKKVITTHEMQIRGDFVLADRLPNNDQHDAD